MLRVWTIAGEELAARSVDEIRDVRNLKLALRSLLASTLGSSSISSGCENSTTVMHGVVCK